MTILAKFFLRSAMSSAAEVFPDVRKIAVIGAGQSGLCTVRYFTADPVYRVVAYEQQDRIGGLWNYPEGCEDHNKEQDETSPYFCRMHRNLVANTPKYHQVFSGDENYTEEMDMFPTLSAMNRYLNRYAESHDLRQYIKLRHLVKSISSASVSDTDSTASSRSKQKWTLTVLNIATNTETSEAFDIIVICNGQYRKPYIPEVPTIKNFLGSVLHSGEYRNRELYKDKNVLIIGDGLSADETVCDLWKLTRKLFLVRRRFLSTFADSSKFPNVHLLPEPLNFTAEGLILSDGTVRAIDTVILCTGYMLSFPFLTPECGVEYSRGRAFPLYRHMINCRYPSMAFIGCIQKIIPVITVAEEQVKYYKAWLDGIFTLPTSEEMLKDCERDYQERIAEGAPEHRVHNMFPFEKKLFPYLDTLAKEGNFEPWSEAKRQIWSTSAWNVVLEPCTARNYHFQIVDKDTYSVCKVNEPQMLAMNPSA